MRLLRLIFLFFFCQNDVARSASQELYIQAYTAYGNREENRVQVFGRVIKSEEDPAYVATTNRFKHFLRVVELFLVSGAPAVEVRASIDNNSAVFITNPWGYFHGQFKLDHAIEEPLGPAGKELPTVKIDYNLVHNDGKRGRESRVILSDPKTTKIVVSDIDDTILKSRATSFLSLAFKTLIYPPNKREVFPEVTKTYADMRASPKGNEKNLFFYVSSSAWELYPLLKEFLRIHKLPEGPLILQDVKGEKSENPDGGHTHKIRRITEIINTYKASPLILIGDAGQRDQELYLQLAESFPDRIEKILIRRSWWVKQTEDPEQYIQRAKEIGVPIVYFDNLSELRQADSFK